MITYKQFENLFEHHAKLKYCGYSYEFDGLNTTLEFSFSLYGKKYHGEFTFVDFENDETYLVKAKITQKLNLVIMKFNHTPRKIRIGDFTIYNGLQPYVVIQGNGQLEVKVL